MRSPEEDEDERGTLAKTAIDRIIGRVTAKQRGPRLGRTSLLCLSTLLICRSSKDARYLYTVYERT